MSMKVPEQFSTLVLGRERVTVQALVAELGLKEVTVRNYLSRMHRGGSLERIGRGRYLVKRRAGLPQKLPADLLRPVKLIRRSFPDLEPVAWASSMVSEYMHNVPGRDLLVVDVKRGSAGRVAEFLAERGILVLRDPAEDVLGTLAWSDLTPLFLFGMGERIASTRADGYRVATIERVWLDMYYLITRRGLPFPLHEMGTILANALRAGAISVDTMLKYSSRRGLRAELLFVLYELGKLYDDLDALVSVLPHGRRANGWVDEVVTGAQEA